MFGGHGPFVPPGYAYGYDDILNCDLSMEFIQEQCCDAHGKPGPFKNILSAEPEPSPESFQ